MNRYDHVQTVDGEPVVPADRTAPSPRELHSDDQIFVGLTPLIQVFDMTASLAFYRDLLGFRVVSASPEVETPEGRFSHSMGLRLGAVNLMLNTQYDSGERPQEPVAARSAAHGDTCFYIACSDIDGACRNISDRGLSVAPPTLAPYGLNLFTVQDPDGYSVTFQEYEQSAEPDVQHDVAETRNPANP